MNPISQLSLVTLLADTAPAPAGGLETGTVLLGLMVVAVAWLASSVSNLRNEVETLKDMVLARPRPSATPSVPAPAAGPSPADVAAIAAAVHCMLGAGARVVAVVPPDAGGQHWSREGRREVFQSHQIR